MPQKHEHTPHTHPNKHTAAYGGLFELDIRHATPVWRNLSSLDFAPSARYGHAMVGVGSMVVLSGGAYGANQLADAVNGSNMSVARKSARGYFEDSLYVLATFDEYLFLPHWMDISQFSTIPMLQHHAGTAIERSVWLHVSLMWLHTPLVCSC